MNINLKYYPVIPAPTACAQDNQELLEKLDELREELMMRTLWYIDQYLPQKQKSRISKYFNGQHQKDIAKEEGVSQPSVHISIWGRPEGKIPNYGGIYKVRLLTTIDYRITQILDEIKQVQGLLND